MRFDIDSVRAKAMATRLQDFLSQNPKPKLSRSSAIEAVARMLGFNNRNAMLAEIGKPAKDEMPQTIDPNDTLDTALSAFLLSERNACATAIVDEVQLIDASKPFSDAINIEAAGGNGTALHIVEDRLAEKMNADPKYKNRLHAALLGSLEFEGALEQRSDLVDACAMALVNESLDAAEAIFDSIGEGEIDEDDLADWVGAVEDAADRLDLAIRSRKDIAGTIYPLAEQIAARFEENVGRVIADIRQNFIALRGKTPEEMEIALADESHTSWDVDVSCWIQGSLQVSLPGDRVGEIEAEVLHFAMIQVDAATEEDALRRAQSRLVSEDFSMIWNPRPDRGIRNARWASSEHWGDAETLIKADLDAVDDHWEFEPSRASDFSADQVV